jgi:P4 family phage/plasmid primase-like protien
VALYERGFLPLVSVIPPNAPLSPDSRIHPSQCGKVPGRRNANGTWGGYNWLGHEVRAADVKAWAHAGANIGIRAEFYPAVDIDSLDPWLTAEVERLALQFLGPAPVRVGRAPKRLLMYRTGEPFVRAAALVRMGGDTHLVEVLGKGRQYVIQGQHPSGSQYTWNTPLDQIEPEKLTWITPAQVETFLTTLKDLLEIVPGVEVERVGGKVHDRTPQADLLAPSIEALRACVAAIPNADLMFPERNDYVQFGYAVRAAAGEEHEEDGYEVWCEWLTRWDGGTNDLDTAREDWRRMKPPYAVGWSWLAEIAARCGFQSAQYEFAADAVEVRERAQETPPLWSDAWLVDRVVEEHGGAIRHVPVSGRWYSWHLGRWEPDAVLLVDHQIGQTLRRLAAALMHQGVTDAEKAANHKLAKMLCSAQKQRDVRHLLRSDPRVTATMDAFDADPWLLNTPGGILDLRTGHMVPHDPAAMCSRQTSVAPDADLPMPRWRAFLEEVTAGDLDLQGYLQRLAGYALTGRTTEQMLAFIWGPGWNGKGVLVRALLGVLRTYAETAPMETFTASKYDKHPTDLAGLVGARLVTATETQGGRHWDEQRIKLVTGGDAIRVRFMRQDFFTFTPQFTPIFTGNHKPEIRNLDVAMRRRIHLVNFTVTPSTIDPTLDEALRVEYPAILAWAVDGCAQWQQVGLAPPNAVLAATADYFQEQDPIARWVEDACEPAPTHRATTMELFHAWCDWAGEQGEAVGTARRLTQTLTAKRYTRWKDGRRSGFVGLRPIVRLLTEGGVHELRSE